MLKVLLVLLFLLISILDVITTQTAIKKGLYEFNLILRYIYNKWGVAGHVFFKLITAGFFVVGLAFISVEALVVICIVFTLIVINNLWVIRSDDS